MKHKSANFLSEYLLYLIGNLSKHHIVLHEVTLDILIDMLLKYNNDNEKLMEFMRNLAKYEILLKYPEKTNKYIIKYIQDDKLVNLQFGGNDNTINSSLFIKINYDEIKSFIENNKDILVSIPDYDKKILDIIDNMPLQLTNKHKIINILKKYNVKNI